MRDAPYLALFALLSDLKTQGAVGVCGRRVRLLDEMAAAELPALFVGVDHQHVEYPDDIQSRLTLRAKVYLYAACTDRHASAGAALNALIDAVDAALAPAPGEPFQTLGGLVRSARIEGEIEVYEAIKSVRAAAILTVSMVLP